MKIITAIFTLLLTWNIAHADPNCEVTIFGNDQMRYVDTNDKRITQITVPKKCTKFTILFKYKGRLPKQAMGHNVVIVPTNEFNKVIAMINMAEVIQIEFIAM